MIRRAHASDVTRVIKLCRLLHAKSSYSHIPIDENKFKRLFATCCVSQQAFVWVAEYDGEITAVIIGMIDEYFFSRKKYATDILFHSTKGGGYLIRRFVRWACANKSVVDLRLGASADVDDGKVAALYEKLGLAKIGELFFKETGRDENKG